MPERKLARFYRITLPCVILLLLLVINGCTANKTAMPNAVQPSLSGRLLIDISDHNSNLYGFLLQLPEGDVRKTYQEIRTFFQSANEAKLEILQHPNYKEIFDAERWYNREMEKQLKETLSSYDMDLVFEEAIKRKPWHKKEESKMERYFLPAGKNDFKGNYSFFYYPNKQFTLAVHARAGAHLIDLKTKEVFFPFGRDRLETLVWDKSGQTIAYVADKLLSYDKYAFVIMKAVEGRTILRKELAAVDGIADVAFSPDAKHVAVISYTKRPGFWPHEILLQSSGHGIFYHTYNLEIYDMSGKVVFEKTLSGSYKNSAAHIVWID